MKPIETKPGTVIPTGDPMGPVPTPETSDALAEAPCEHGTIRDEWGGCPECDKEHQKPHAWIGKPYQEDGYWLVWYGICGEELEYEFVTQGTDEYNAYEMAADALCCVQNISPSWYRKLIYRIFRV